MAHSNQKGAGGSESVLESAEFQRLLDLVSSEVFDEIEVQQKLRKVFAEIDSLRTENKELHFKLGQITAPTGAELDEWNIAEVKRKMTKLEMDHLGGDDWKLQKHQRKYANKQVAKLRKAISWIIKEYIENKLPDPRWMENIPPKLKLLIKDIKTHSMDLDANLKLCEEKKWDKFLTTIKSGNNAGKAVSYQYVLYIPDKDRLKEKLEISETMIWVYLDGLVKAIPHAKKMGKTGRRGQMVYAFGYHTDYGRKWFFTKESEAELKTFKPSSKR